MKIDGTLRRTIAIIMPGKRLVAAREPDQRVIGMAAHGQLDQIGDHLARDKRSTSCPDGPWRCRRSR